LREPFLEPLHAGVGDLRQPLGEDTRCFTFEGRDGSFELATEPLRRLLARVFDRVGELLCSDVRVAGGSAVDGALELLEVLALDFRKADLDAPGRIRLLPLDLLRERLLAAAERIRNLVQRTPALRRLRLELR
jgi:hypothetical protein